MPNGISCAFFAGRNLVYGKKEGNIFKQGIGAIQTTRTVDSAAQSGLLQIKGAPFLNQVTKVIKKLLYPLIIGSGIYNTIKAEDKTRTGASQAGGIGTMYLFEQVAEKGLVNAEKSLLKNPTIKNNKLLRSGVYVLKGLGFVAASLGGYEVGSKVAEKAVDTFRNSKQTKAELQES